MVIETEILPSPVGTITFFSLDSIRFKEEERIFLQIHKSLARCFTLPKKCFALNQIL